MPIYTENSQRDNLTGLMTMNDFFERAEIEKAAMLERDGHPILLYTNFMGMGFFNNKYGFTEGSGMLREIAGLLRDILETKCCCRIGADHFAVCTEEKGIEEKLERIFREWKERCSGRSLPMHVGIYRSRGESIHISVALDRAKLACTSIKDNYSSSFRYYSDELSEEVSRKQYIIENLDTAIRENWIKVYIQPIIRTVNEQVCDTEALARWIDPEKGFLSPADFIPALEEAGIIYKLDLYMLEQVLTILRKGLDGGFFLVPVSINLSRSDFDVCDMVEEFRSRVDEAGIRRNLITVEITESIMGRDFEFMKEQVERFRELGFPVWMDDFGSGYSSLDVLQSIKFDLIKFDMSFMTRLEAGKEGRILLTELMRMATSLGLDTVCEGVETGSQVRFLREIGCSKLQGYYYSKPVPFDQAQDLIMNGSLIRHENPEEAEYYESIGRVNLFDLGVIVSEDEDALQHTFNSIPIAIMEVKKGEAHYIRSNHSYQEFNRRFFHVDIQDPNTNLVNYPVSHGEAFVAAVKECCHGGSSVFFDEKLPDGSVAHCFVRRVSMNPVTGSVAVAVAVFSITEPEEEEIKKLREERESLKHIAALSEDYLVFYTVDPETGHYTQYHPTEGFENLDLAMQGQDFFGDAKRDAPKAIDPRDIERHLRVFTRENIMKKLRNTGRFVHKYRLLLEGSSVPVVLRATLGREEDGEKIILGVTREYREAFEQARDNSIIFSHIAHALARGYTDLFYVNMDTNELIEYHTDDVRGVLTEARRSADFFEGCERDAKLYVHPEDQEQFVTAMNRDFLMNALKKNNIFEMTYRRIKEGRTFYVRMKVTRIEPDRPYIVIAVSDIDELMKKRRIEEQIREERIIYARLHALTGNFMVVYVVDPETDEYREFSSTDEYEEDFSQEKTGKDFFTKVRKEAATFNHPEDMNRFLSAFTKEKVLAKVEKNGIYTLGYRLVIGDNTAYVQLKAAMVEEQEGLRLIVGLNNITDQVRAEQNYKNRLAEAQANAKMDALTGVRNRQAYLSMVSNMDHRITDGTQPPFAMVMLDVNDLKKINDTEGHKAGDQWLRNACKTICDIFSHSPVFRIGGDEFAVIVQGSDYDHLEELMEKVHLHNREAQKTHGVVIACGMAKHDGETGVAAVFERADNRMYENKKALKEEVRQQEEW